MSVLRRKSSADSLYYELAFAMREKLNLHLWYLSEELVFLCLFSKLLSDAEKNLCAKAMKRYHLKKDLSLNPSGKLTTPVLSKTRANKLWEFFGPNSWLMPNLLGLGIKDLSFVSKPAKSWKLDKDYQLLQSVIHNMQVVNDPAERGILLAKSLQGKVTMDPTERRKLFLSIPYAREQLKKITRNTLQMFDIV